MVQWANIFLLCVLSSFQPAACHLNTTTTATKRNDVTTGPINFASGLASTYLMNWLKKTTSALANINNLSSKQLMFDSCDGENVAIPVLPTDLDPVTGTTDMEAYNPAGIFKNAWQKALAKNIWVRCAFKTNFRVDSGIKIASQKFFARSKIVFVLSVRGTSGREFLGKLHSGWETTQTSLAIAMCDEKKQGDCKEYDSIKSMKALVEAEKKDDNIQTAAFTKGQNDKLNPIYFCHKDTKHCVSASMGNGGNSVSQIFIHDYPELPETVASFAPQHVI